MGRSNIQMPQIDHSIRTVLIAQSCIQPLVMQNIDFSRNWVHNIQTSYFYNFYLDLKLFKYKKCVTRISSW